MTIALPANAIAEAEPFFIDRGGVMSSALNGPDQRLNRLGSRFGCTFRTKPLKGEDARVWIARLIRGRHETATIKFPQPGVTPSRISSGSAFVYGAHAANASVVRLVTNNTAWKEGEFLSFLVDGSDRYHTHQVIGTGVWGGGVFPVTIQPPTRRAMAANTPAIMPPIIQGYVKGDQNMPWTADVARIYGLSFTIEEAE